MVSYNRCSSLGIFVILLALTTSGSKFDSLCRDIPAIHHFTIVGTFSDVINPNIHKMTVQLEELYNFHCDLKKKPTYYLAVFLLSFWKRKQNASLNSFFNDWITAAAFRL